MAVYKNVASQKVACFAYDSSDGSAKTGDAANITAQISKDGAATAATDDTNPTELDATDAPGIYIFDLTQAETNADMIVIAPVSSTADILIEPLIIYTTPGDSTAIDANVKEVSDDETAANDLELFIEALGTDDKVLVSTDAQDLSGTLDVNTKTITDGAITAAKLGADAITSAKIADDAICDEHWNVTAVAGCAVSSIGNNVITTASINDGAITNAKVADDVDVNTKTITAGAVNAAAIADAAIDAATFAADVDAEVRGWLGMASADLDTKLDAISAYVDCLPATLDGSTLDSIPDMATATNQATIAGYIDTEIGTIITHLTDIKGATFSGATDSLEAIRDRGDVAWVTATGFLDAAGVRAAIGLSTANLDTQLSAISGYVDCLPASWVTVPTASQVSTQVASDLATAHGAGSWATATGFSTHSASDVKTAIEAAGSSLAQILEDTGTTIPATITTIDTLLDKMAPAVIGTVTGAGTGTEVFVYGGVTVTYTVDANGNRSNVVFS